MVTATKEFSRDRSHDALDLLRTSTAGLHKQAEHTGLLRQLLIGKASIDEYALFLRGLLPVYQNMERALCAVEAPLRYGQLANPAIYRAPAIEADLTSIVGADWQRQLPLLPAAKAYAQRIEHVVEDAPTRLIGHIYTRYLGDLSGGRILRRILSKTYQLADDDMHFYSFPQIDDPDLFKQEYLGFLVDRVMHNNAAKDVTAEAMTAFQFNIAVSMEVLETTRGSAAAIAGASD